MPMVPPAFGAREVPDADPVFTLPASAGPSTVQPLEAALPEVHEPPAHMDHEPEVVQAEAALVQAASDIPFDLPEKAEPTPAEARAVAKTAKAEAKNAEDEARQKLHHASWKKDRRWFQGQRAEIVAGTTYEELAAFCAAKLGKRPSRMTTEERHELLEKLRDPDRRARFIEWVVAMQGDPLLAAEHDEETEPIEQVPA
jgi:hypothetical protein